jgi:4-alpha-glucanotransferase
VRYRPEDLYAILAVESHRHRSIIVGEDLGIVPGYIRPTMARHGLHRMYISYYELADSVTRTPRRVPRKCVASLNTHDMPPFASFWEGEDIRENVRLGLLSEKESEAEKENRRVIKAALTTFLRDNGFLKKAGNGTRAALQACLAFLSASQAHTVLINMEDLWLENQAQNIPGTGDRLLNWRRKARYRLEEFCCMSEINDILREVADLRKRIKRQVRKDRELGL